jgi:hypothetical protein
MPVPLRNSCAVARLPHPKKPPLGWLSDGSPSPKPQTKYPHAARPRVVEDALARLINSNQVAFARPETGISPYMQRSHAGASSVDGHQITQEHLRLLDPDSVRPRLGRKLTSWRVLLGTSVCWVSSDRPSRLLASVSPQFRVWLPRTRL